MKLSEVIGLAKFRLGDMFDKGVVTFATVSFTCRIVYGMLASSSDLDIDCEFDIYSIKNIEPKHIDIRLDNPFKYLETRQNLCFVIGSDGFVTTSLYRNPEIIRKHSFTRSFDQFSIMVNSPTYNDKMRGLSTKLDKYQFIDAMIEEQCCSIM